MGWRAKPEKKQNPRVREHEQFARQAAKGPIDLPFLMLVVLLTVIGLVMLLSASFPSAYYETGSPTYYFTRQAIFAILGFVGMFFASNINYTRYRGFARLALIVSGILLLLVLIPGIGVVRNNARRWIGIGDVFTFQPSEIAKLGVILYFADSIAKKREKMNSFRQGVLPYAGILGTAAVLMFFEPHLSGTVLILGIGAVMMFAGGMQLRWVLMGLVLVVGAVYAFMAGMITYNSSRIDIWLDPLNDAWATGAGYQIRQSLIAIGSGGLTGTGLGKSRQKFLFLPEEHNDFIFAIVCEELGYIGALLIMALYFMLVMRGYWIAIHARERFGSLLVIGVTTQIALQTFLNIAVVTNLFPNTGISLPFFSYGGTALAIQLVEMGLVLSVSRQMPAS